MAGAGVRIRGGAEARGVRTCLAGVCVCGSARVYLFSFSLTTGLSPSVLRILIEGALLQAER